jgi:hypothetical protein
VADIRSTGVADAGGIAVVGVDSNQARDAGGLDVLDDHVTGALALVVAAVAAGAVELTGVDNGESVNGDGSGTVVLNDLVAGLLGATTLDEGIAVSDNGDGVLWGRVSIGGPGQSWDYSLLTSQTSRNQTLVRVQDPSQWMPSSWFSPMMTLLRDAPSFRMNTALSSPISG